MGRGPSGAVSGAREKPARPSAISANPPVRGLGAARLPLWCGTWSPFLQRENADGQAQWCALDRVRDRKKDINGKIGEIKPTLGLVNGDVLTSVSRFMASVTLTLQKVRGARREHSVLLFLQLFCEFKAVPKLSLFKTALHQFIAPLRRHRRGSFATTWQAANIFKNSALRQLFIKCLLRHT